MPREKAAKKKKKTPNLEPEGLRKLVQHRLLNECFQYCADNWEGWMVLIVDKKSMKVLSNAVGMYDVFEKRVTLVEDITKKRAPFKDMGAIYFLAPTEDSVNRLIEDYSKTPLYGQSCFVFFLGRLPEKHLAKIKECRPLVKRIKALSETNVDFLAKELRAFHFDMRRAFKDVYVRKGRSKVEGRMAEKLVSVCATLNELPHVRFFKDSPSGAALANSFHVKMEQFARKNEDFWYHGDPKHTTRERAMLLILDRKDDCLTPLMHDFTYQAMANDLLKIKDDKITVLEDVVEDVDYDDDYDKDDDYDESNRKTEKSGKKVHDDEDEDEDDDDSSDDEEIPESQSSKAKDILLNDDDKLWVELRGKHIATVAATLGARCSEMLNSDTSGFKSKDKGKSMSLSQMASALKALPEYKEVMAKLNQHMLIATNCMDKFKGLGLQELGDLEQTLATGEDSEGKKPSQKEIIKRVEEALGSLDSAKARLRLLMITIVSQQGLTPEDKETLWAAAKLSAQHEKVIDNMRNHLEISIINEGSSSTLKSLFGSKAKSTGRVDEDAEFQISRYVPPMRGILEDLIAHRLSIEEYPSVAPLPESHATSGGTAHSARRRPEGSARKGGATSRWQRSKPKEASKDESFTGGRLIVFVIGGMSFAELRVAREVMSKESKEIIAGSTIFTKPEDFIQDVKEL